MKDKISKLNNNRTKFINQSILWKKRKFSEDLSNSIKQKNNKNQSAEKRILNKGAKGNKHRGKSEINIEEMLNVNPFFFRISRKNHSKNNENKIKKNTNELLMSDLNIYSRINETLGNLQKVFVEDLGRELLMDQEGNLFDEKGEFMGQADIDEIDFSKHQKESSSRKNDLKENSI